MAKAAKGGFTFPKNNQCIACPTDPISKLPTFRATGFFVDGTALLDPNACLVTYTDKGKPKQVQGSIVLNNPEAWVVQFADAGLVAGNNTPPFTCAVANLDGDPLSVNFTVQDPKKIPAKLTVLLTHITYPTTPDNNTVPSTFACTGTTDSTSPVSGSLIDGSSNVFPGVTTSQGPDWVILFSDIPAGVYTLTVVALPDMSSVSPVVVVPNPGTGGGGLGPMVE